jgi:glycosyltransferase involved in cell wall biosynthesis
LDLGKNIDFLGRVSEEEKVKLLSSAWVFVQPSTMEGWGISVVEANACGTPVVASKVPGLVDSVKNPYTGFTVEPKNENEFAKAISKLLNDRKLRSQFSKNSIEWAKKFSWQEKSNEFMNVVETVFSNQKDSSILEVASTN